MRNPKKMLSKRSVITLLLCAFLTAAQPSFRNSFAKGTPETTVGIEPSTVSANLTETLTVNVTIANVQNLYGLEIALSWNASVLNVVSVDVRLGIESHPDGIIHEYPNAVYVAENKVWQSVGLYRLAATTVAPSPPFNGTGNAVRITFNVTGFGESKFNLETQLYDFPPPDRDPNISWPIEHTTIDGYFYAVPEIGQTSILLVLTISATLILLSRKRTQKKRGSTDLISQSSEKTY